MTDQQSNSGEDRPRVIFRLSRKEMAQVAAMAKENKTTVAQLAKAALMNLIKWGKSHDRS